MHQQLLSVTAQAMQHIQPAQLPASQSHDSEFAVRVLVMIDCIVGAHDHLH